MPYRKASETGWNSTAAVKYIDGILSYKNCIVLWDRYFLPTKSIYSVQIHRLLIFIWQKTKVCDGMFGLAVRLVTVIKSSAADVS